MFTIKNNKIYITATLRDREGKVVGEIINNFWRVNQNNYFLLNYDKRGVEIIDMYGKVAISADLIDKRTISVTGIIDQGVSGVYILSQKGTVQMGSYQDHIRLGGTPQEWASRYEYYTSLIKKIFDYEGFFYIGKRAK